MTTQEQSNVAWELAARTSEQWEKEGVNAGIAIGALVFLVADALRQPESKKIGLTAEKFAEAVKVIINGESEEEQ